MALNLAPTDPVDSAQLDSGNSGLRNPLDPMPRRDRRAWWATLFVLCGLLGAMLGLSVKTQNAKTHHETLTSQQGRDVLVQANLDLQRRIAQLQKDNAQLALSTPSDTRRLKELSDDLARAQFLAGLTDVKGPGIIVTLNDSKNPAVSMPAGFAPPNIIHDTDIAAVVNELKAAGAEAISVNGQRIVAVSPVRCVGPTVMVNFTPQTPPFVIKAIGSPKTLYTAIELPGGVTKDIRAYDPAMFTTQISKQPLLIPAYAGGLEPKYAQPAGVDAKTASAAKNKVASN